MKSILGNQPEKKTIEMKRLQQGKMLFHQIVHLLQVFLFLEDSAHLFPTN